MAAARSQPVFSDNTCHAPTLDFTQDVRVPGWTTVGNGAGRTKGSGAYVIYDCDIITKEVRLCLCRWCCLCLTWLAGWIENNNAYFETI